MRQEGRDSESIWTLCRELCKNSCTHRDAVWDAESGGSMEPSIRWGAHWHNLVNTTEPSACGGESGVTASEAPRVKLFLGAPKER